jgi:hypothetical protein
MTDSSQIATGSEQAIIKLKNALDQLVERNGDTNDASAILSDAMSLFKTFFDNIGNPEFTPVEFKHGDTPRSLDYNSNLKQIFNDISRFYKEIENLNTTTIKSFNYSQIVTTEIRKRAESIAGMVLDLNILNGFTRGDVIVAGDDFINFDKLDSSAGLSASKAELLSNGSGISLARIGSNNLTENPRIKVQVIPLSPGSSGGTSAVNTTPTPGNYNRFYEGCYYAFLGQARPEGGRFNLKSIDVIPEPPPPAASNPSNEPTNPPGAEPGGSTRSGNFFSKLDRLRRGNTGKLGKGFEKLIGFGRKKRRPEPEVPPPPPPDPQDPETYYLEFGATEEEKEIARRKMFDNNPDTFWECEYIVSLKDPLINIEESRVSNQTSDAAPDEAPTTTAIQIDVDNLNTTALEKDILDFSVDIIVTLPEQQSVNFVSINPVIFSKSAYVSIVDISTSKEEEGVFVTVPGWESLKFAKTITPEANEYLTDSQVAATLAPSRFNYTSQGIYPFPTTIAKKIKITLLMDKPSSQIYERTYILMRNTVEIENTVTTTRTSRKLGL